MSTKKIFTINHVDIVVTDDNYVPIKPICEALGVDDEGQRQRIERDEILSSVTFMTKATGKDGKTYEMLALPVKYVFGWLFTIDSSRVNQEIRDMVVKYKRECYETLYNHFNGQQQRRNEQDALEKSLLAERDAVDELEKNLKEQMTIVKKQKAGIEQKLERIREERLNNEPTLF